MSGTRSCVIAKLSCQDVQHEWRMSLCMILAVLAIATPLLLFFGLKAGVVNTLRERLLANPVTLEILPIAEKRLDAAWFEHARKDARVAFVVPHTRRLAAQAEFAGTSYARGILLDLAPTLAGDVLLERYEMPKLERGECILADSAQRRIGVKAGSEIICRVTRDRGTVKAERKFKVKGVLPARAGTRAVVYLRLEDLEQIEAFKDGRSVPELGWSGSDPLAYPVIPKALLVLPTPLDATREALLTQNTGFAKLTHLDAPPEILAPWLPQAATIYQLQTVANQADSRDVQSLAERVRGYDALVIPYNPALRLKFPNGQIAQVAACTALKRNYQNLVTSEEETIFTAQHLPAHIYVSQELAATWSTALIDVEAYVEGKEDISVRFPIKLTPNPSLKQDQVLCPLSLLGQLSLLADRPLKCGHVAYGEQALVLGRRGYTGFRMYAQNLELVKPLQQDLEAQGITVHTRADRIEEVLALDHYLDILFWVIATASLLGGIGCLISNVYANVERKRRELAVLRLLGVHGSSLCLFPLVQALLLTLGGLSISFVLFHALAFAINSFFQAQLAPGESFCCLSLGQHLIAVGLAFILALLTGLAASVRMLKIEPADSLRDE